MKKLRNTVCPCTLHWNQSLEVQMTKTMLEELTIEANEEYFVIVLQHGGSDVT